MSLNENNNFHSFNSNEKIVHHTHGAVPNSPTMKSMKENFNIITGAVSPTRMYSPVSNRSGSPSSPLRNFSPNTREKYEKYFQDYMNKYNLGSDKNEVFLNFRRNFFNSILKDNKKEVKKTHSANKNYKFNFNPSNSSSNPLANSLAFPSIAGYKPNKNDFNNFVSFEGKHPTHQSSRTNLLMNRYGLDDEVEEIDSFNKFKNKKNLNFKGFNNNSRDYSFNLFNLDIESK